MHPVLAGGPSDQVRVRAVADADVVPEGSPVECDVIGPKTLIAVPALPAVRESATSAQGEHPALCLANTGDPRRGI